MPHTGLAEKLWAGVLESEIIFNYKLQAAVCNAAVSSHDGIDVSKALGSISNNLKGAIGAVPYFKQDSIEEENVDVLVEKYNKFYEQYYGK